MNGLTQDQVAIISHDVALHFGEIITSQNTHGNVSFYVAKKFGVSSDTCKKIADLYIEFLSIKRAAYIEKQKKAKEIERFNLELNRISLHNTGFTLVQNFAHAFKNLKYSMPV